MFPSKRAREDKTKSNCEDTITVEPLDVKDYGGQRTKLRQVLPTDGEFQPSSQQYLPAKFVIPRLNSESDSHYQSAVRRVSSNGFNISCNTSLISHDRSGRRMPTLVYRWYNCNSQGFNSPHAIRAGLFRNPSVPVSSPLTGPCLQKALLNHLTPREELSPFISTFESPLPAIHRALRSERQTDPCIAIIDLKHASSALEAMFPDSEEFKYLVPTIIKRYSFKLRNRYKASEWLVHGIIDRSAIVATIKISDIWHIAQYHDGLNVVDILNFVMSQPHAAGLGDLLKPRAPTMSYLTGLVVGNFLTDVPDSHKALVARKIANAFHFRGIRADVSNVQTQEYLRGIYDLPEGTQFLATPSKNCYQSHSRYSKEGSFVTFSDEDDDGFESDESYSTDWSLEGNAISDIESADDQALVDAQLQSSLDASLPREKSYLICVEVKTRTPETSLHPKTIASKVKRPPLLAATRKSKNKIEKLTITATRPEIKATKVAPAISNKMSTRCSDPVVAITPTKKIEIIDLTGNGDDDDDLLKPTSREEDIVVVSHGRRRKWIRMSSTPACQKDHENNNADSYHGKRFRWAPLASTSEYSVLAFRSKSVSTGPPDKGKESTQPEADVMEILQT